MNQNSEVAMEMNIPFLGRLSIDSELASLCDSVKSKSLIRII
ncbi:hypothetical protein SAMN05660242_3026 [Thermoanaerobacterium sp. RBIITD]|nr:hypothetical protein SAMN05660242_3026 [Thermoanaerobacterium sp. RBIITD]